MSVHNMYQYIKRPVFAIQDMFDTNILFSQAKLPRHAVSTHLGQEYVAYIGNCTKASMQQILEHPQGKQGDGMFLPACLNHGSSQAVAIDGFVRNQGLGDWFFGRNSA